jgi:hypothetical protein
MNTPPTSDFEPIDLDEHMRLRTHVLETWKAWDEQPTNTARVKAHVDACVAYFGVAHNSFAKFASEVVRAGGSKQSALELWESDW